MNDSHNNGNNDTNQNKISEEVIERISQSGKWEVK
jgi:hypothetical protein